MVLYRHKLLHDHRLPARVGCENWIDKYTVPVCHLVHDGHSRCISAHFCLFVLSCLLLSELLLVLCIGDKYLKNIQIVFGPCTKSKPECRFYKMSCCSYSK